MSSGRGKNKPLSGSLINYSAPLAKGLVAFYLLNDTGRLANASGVPRYNGTTIGALPRAGKFGQCLWFDGTDDYVEANLTNATNSPSSTGTFEESWSMWVCRTGAPGAAKGLFQSAAAGSLSSSMPTRYLQMAADYTLRVLPCNTAYGGYTTTKLDLNTWVHVVWTRTASGTSNKLYMNGRQEADTSINSNCALLYVQIANGYGGYFPGYIDHFAVYNRCLSAGEVKRLYSDPFAMFQRQKLIIKGYTVAYSKSLSATETVSPALSKTSTFKRTLTKVAGGVVSLLRLLPQSIVATAVSAASVAAAWITRLSLSSAATTVADLVTAFHGTVLQALSATATGVASVTPAVFFMFQQALSAVATGVTSLTALFITGLGILFSTAGEVIDVLENKTDWLIDTVGRVYLKIMDTLFEKL